VNAWTPLAVSRVGLLVLTLFGIDKMFPGNTIEGIVCIHIRSDWKDKLVAAIFMLGMGYLVVLSSRGQF
jgi:hypothetical protein